jgi:hypothetical protein
MELILHDIDRKIYFSLPGPLLFELGTQSQSETHEAMYKRRREFAVEKTWGFGVRHI